MAALSMAVMPTLAHALAFANGDDTTQICTPQGMKIVSLDPWSAEEGGAPTSQASLDHCPYGMLASGAAPLPASPSQWHAQAAGTAEAPPAFFQAPRTLFAWASAQPRAPPVLF
jgi:hypothetical protein